MVKKKTKKAIRITLIVVLVITILLILLSITNVVPLSVASGPPSLPVAIYGLVMDDSQLVQSGEVRCYSGGQDVSQRPSEIFAMWGHESGGYSLICLAIPDEVRVNGETYPQNPSLIVKNRGEIKQVNLVKGGCDINCQNILSNPRPDYFGKCLRFVYKDNYGKNYYTHTFKSASEEEGFYILDEKTSERFEGFLTKSECESYELGDPLPNHPDLTCHGYQERLNRCFTWTSKNCQVSMVYKQGGNDELFNTREGCDSKVQSEILNMNCQDSDGGIVFEIKGTTSNRFDSKTDECKDSDKIRETYCSDGGAVFVRTTECQNGCSNGVCIVNENAIQEEEENFEDLGEDPNADEDVFEDETEEAIEDEILDRFGGTNISPITLVLIIFAVVIGGVLVFGKFE